VIVDSDRLKSEAFRELYSAHSEDVIERVVSYHTAHAGISRVVKILHCHREFLGIELTDIEHKKLCQTYASIVEEKVVACPEIVGATSFLQSHQGKCQIFVVSGTPEDELQRISHRRELDGYFDAVYGSPRTKDVIVNSILSETGIAPSECLFVGDAMTDYRAAEETGVPFIGRVDAGDKGPFPIGTRIVPDLNALAKVLGEA
jgi:phosphoglycolate phosphatase